MERIELLPLLSLPLLSLPRDCIIVANVLCTYGFRELFWTAVKHRNPGVSKWPIGSHVPGGNAIPNGIETAKQTDSILFDWEKTACIFNQKQGSVKEQSCSVFVQRRFPRGEIR